MFAAASRSVSPLASPTLKQVFEHTASPLGASTSTMASSVRAPIPRRPQLRRMYTSVCDSAGKSVTPPLPTRLQSHSRPPIASSPNAAINASEYFSSLASPDVDTHPSLHARRLNTSINLDLRRQGLGLSIPRSPAPTPAVERIGLGIAVREPSQLQHSDLFPRNTSALFPVPPTPRPAATEKLADAFSDMRFSEEAKNVRIKPETRTRRAGCARTVRFPLDVVERMIEQEESGWDADAEEDAPKKRNVGYRLSRPATPPKNLRELLSKEDMEEFAELTKDMA